MLNRQNWKVRLLKSCLLFCTITKCFHLILPIRHQTACARCLYYLALRNLIGKCSLIGKQRPDFNREIFLKGSAQAVGRYTLQSRRSTGRSRSPRCTWPPLCRRWGGNKWPDRASNPGPTSRCRSARKGICADPGLAESKKSFATSISGNNVVVTAKKIGQVALFEFRLR